MGNTLYLRKLCLASYIMSKIETCFAANDRSFLDSSVKLKVSMLII